MPEFITDGALMQCDKGVAPSKLTVTSQQGCLIAGKAQATIKDKAPNANIPPFGVCAVTQKSCMPQPTAWLKAGPYTIDGVQELTTDSFCMCGLGGKIQFLQSGNSGFVKLKYAAGAGEHGPMAGLQEEDDPPPVDDVYFTSGLPLTIDKQVGNLCAVWILEFASKKLQGKSHTVSEMLLFAAKEFNDITVITDGLKDTYVDRTVNKFFEVGTFNNYKEAIDNGRPIFTAFPVPNGGHAVLVIGYNTKTNLIHYMDPESGTRGSKNSTEFYTHINFVLIKNK